MSIHLNQEFTYETDTLTDFERMLSLAIPLLFPDGKLRWKAYASQEPWGDNYPGETGYLLGQRSAEERRARGKPLFYHIGEIEDEHGGRSVQDTVHDVVEALISVDPVDFEARCGKYGPFERCDGSIAIGYRMHLCTYRGDRLLISLCHIFYGK